MPLDALRQPRTDGGGDLATTLCEGRASDAVTDGRLTDQSVVLGNVSVAPRASRTSTAMARAEAMFAAAGRADRIACEIAPFSQPWRQHLVRRWLLWCWATREAPEHVGWFRDLLRASIRACRAAEGRG